MKRRTTDGIAKEEQLGGLFALLGEECVELSHTIVHDVVEEDVGSFQIGLCGSVALVDGLKGATGHLSAGVLYQEAESKATVSLVECMHRSQAHSRDWARDVVSLELVSNLLLFVVLWLWAKLTAILQDVLHLAKEAGMTVQTLEVLVLRGTEIR